MLVNPNKELRIMNSTKAITNFVNNGIRVCIPHLDDYLDEVNIEIVYDWVNNNRPDFINFIDRETVKALYLQYKSQKIKQYEIDIYLKLFREENDTVDTIMQKLKINPINGYYRVYIQEHM